MPPTDTSKEPDLQVLITGYGPFAQFIDNPAWLAVAGLHDTYLDSSFIVRRVHIQVLQSPVVYSHVLSLVPLIHGNIPGPDAKPYLDARGEPVSTEDSKSSQGFGAPYPAHYRLEHPKAGYDAVIHVGVGTKGGIYVESQAHKRGYQASDAKGSFAPCALDQCVKAAKLETWLKKLAQGQSFEQSRVQEAEGKRAEQGESTSPPPRVVDSSCVRGFARGYEAYDDELRTHIDTAALVAWLKERGTEHVKESEDPGRFLCDFIYYASLAESRRGNESSPTPVSFIHVPPLDQPYSSEQAKVIIRDVAWWVSSRLA